MEIIIGGAVILYLIIGAFIGLTGKNVGFPTWIAVLMVFIWGPVFIVGLIDEYLIP